VTDHKKLLLDLEIISQRHTAPKAHMSHSAVARRAMKVAPSSPLGPQPLHICVSIRDGAQTWRVRLPESNYQLLL